MLSGVQICHISCASPRCFAMSYIPDKADEEAIAAIRASLVIQIEPETESDVASSDENLIHFENSVDVEAQQPTKTPFGEEPFCRPHELSFSPEGSDEEPNLGVGLALEAESENASLDLTSPWVPGWSVGSAFGPVDGWNAQAKLIVLNVYQALSRLPREALK